MSTTPHWQPHTEFRLTPVAPDVWIARHPLSFCGFAMVTCMTVVRLPGGGLWLHSPIPLGAELKAAVDALGPVQYIVAPNRMHHLYALPCATAYPQARLYVAPGLGDKNPQLATCPPIPSGADAPWHEALDSVFVAGNTELNETVFFHRPSRSLILTDLAVHIGPWDAFATRLYARLNGCYDRFGLSFVLKQFFRDREAARHALQRILEWDFQRIIPAHGPVIQHDAPGRLEEAFRWLW